MSKRIVHCRVCKAPFEPILENENIDWLMPSKNWYYHKECYESWKESKEHTNEDWILMIYDLIVHELKGAYNWNMIEAQRKKCIAQRMTNKGIYYSLYWHFLIKGNKWKEEFGIGIVPNIYKQATDYWVVQESKKAGIVEQIERIAREKLESSPQKIMKTNNRKKKRIKAPE